MAITPALRTSEYLALAAQEEIDPADALALYEIESSSGTDEKAGGNILQVTPAAFAEVMPEGGDINNPRDSAIAGMRYFKKHAYGKGYDAASRYGSYLGGPGFEKTLNTGDPETVNYLIKRANKFENLQQKYAAQTGNYTPGSGNVETGPQPLGLLDLEDNKLPNPDLSADEQLKNFLKTISTLGSDFSKKAGDIRAEYFKSATDVADWIQQKYSVDKTKVLADAAVQAQEGLESASRLSAFGLNSSDVSNMGVQIALRMSKTKQEMDVQLAEINKQQETSFLTDPIGAISSYFTLPSAVARYNGLVRQFNNDEQYLGITAARQQELDAVNRPKFGMQKAAAAVAATQALALDANIKATETKMQAMHFDWQLANGELSRVIAQANFYRELVSMNERNADRKDMLAMKKDKEEAEKAIFREDQIAASMVGITLNSPKDIQRLSAQQKALVNQVKTSGGTQYGDNVYEALKLMNLGNPNLMPEGNRVMYDFATQAWKDAVTVIDKNPELRTLSGKAKEAKITELMAQQFNNWHDNVDQKPLSGSGKQGNIYKAKPASQMILLPDVAKTQLGLSLTAALKANPNWVPSDADVVKFAQTLVFGPNPEYSSPEQAALDVTKYFQSAIKLNNDTFNFQGWKVDRQTAYRFGIDDSNGIKNFADYAQVMRYLIATGWRKQVEGSLSGSAMTDIVAP